MFSASFFQSEFQESISKVVSPEAKHIRVRRPIYYRLLDTLVCIPILFYYLFRGKSICIYDHRNSLVIVAAIVCCFWPNRKDQIYIGDDGFHSVIVDRYGSHFLYSGTTKFKSFLIKVFQRKILALKRLHALKDLTNLSAPGSIFIDFYGLVKAPYTQIHTEAIFIDQPLILAFLSKKEKAILSALLTSYNGIEVILHPRTSDASFYLSLGLSCRRSNNIEGELKLSSKGLRVLSFFSTVLLAGEHYGQTMSSIELPADAPVDMKEYAHAGLSMLDSNEKITLI
tara:strand:+ start:527 stop:1378 length:852 start_codon:yes stop_codon:yes gene_type:complete